MPPPSQPPLVITSPLSFLSGNIGASSVVPVLIMLAFVIWVIYTLILGYHFFRYGSRFWLTVPLFFLYLFVSVCLAFYAVSGLHH